MPSYDVLVTIPMFFDGMPAMGSGNSAPPTVGNNFLGSGYEVQLVTIYCKTKCSDDTVKKLAIAQARKAIVASTAKYDWVTKNMSVGKADADIINRYP